MTRGEMEQTLFDGTPEEITSLRCPDCGGEVSYSYFKAEESGGEYLSVVCACVINRYNGLLYTPNCVKYFGSKATVAKDLKLKESA